LLLLLLLLVPQMQRFSDPNEVENINHDPNAVVEEAPTSPARKPHAFEVVYTPNTPKGSNYANNVYLPPGHEKKYSRRSVDGIDIDADDAKPPAAAAEVPEVPIFELPDDFDSVPPLLNRGDSTC
jgi:hypothetical protein